MICNPKGYQQRLSFSLFWVNLTIIAMETIALLHFVSFLPSLHPFLPIFRPILTFFNGQTGNQNSVLVNFAQESLFTTSTNHSCSELTMKAWNRSQRWVWRNGTWISVKNVLTRKTGLTSQTVTLCYFWRLSTVMTWKVLFYLLSNWNFRKLFENDKPPGY